MRNNPTGMSDWQPHEGEQVIADIQVKDFPFPQLAGVGTIRIPATIVAISGEEATVHLDATLFEGQGEQATVSLSALAPAE